MSDDFVNVSIIICLASVFVGFASWIGWLLYVNGGSQKIMTNIFLGLAVGAISALVTTITLNLPDKEEDRTEFFIVSVFDQRTKEPLWLVRDPKRPETMIYMDPVSHIISPVLRNNTALLNASYETGVKLYYDAITKLLLEQFNTVFHANWDVRISRDRLSESVYWIGDRSTTNTKRVDPEVFAPLFLDASVLDAGEQLQSIIIPAETEVTTELDAMGRKLILESPAVRVEIQINKQSGGSGLGFWSRLPTQGDNAQRYWHQTFQIIISAKFSRYRSAHPQRPKLERWVKNITQQLQHVLDSEEQWGRVRERIRL